VNNLKLMVMGPPSLQRDGQIVEIGRRKSLALLVYLALNPQTYSRETLVELLWPGLPPEQGRASLRRILSDLNKECGEIGLEINGDSVSWPAPDVWVDALEIRARRDAIRQHEHTDGELCASCLEHAVRLTQLSRDHFLAGFSLPDCPAYDEWQFFQSETLLQDLAGALRDLVRYHLRNQQPAEALDYARRWSALDPLLEEPHLALMRIYQASAQRPAALREYREYARLLAQELGVAPGSEIEDLHRAIQQEQPTAGASGAWRSPGAPGGSPPANLPAQSTPFVGRKGELSEIARLLTDPDCRLVTLVGPGGGGKTRLAIQAAGQVVDHFKDGIFFVPLEAVPNGDALVPAISGAFRFANFRIDEMQSQLLSYLEKKRLLLVLDNFDHLSAAVPLVDEILHAAPGVRLLVTSRQKLNLQSEHLLRLEGLEFPEPDTGPDSPADWQQYSAVQLFLQSARRARPSFDPHPDEWPLIAHICRVLDGLPLAILLAAGWVEMLSLEQIAAELESGLDFLENQMADLPERHRSIRTVFDSAWKLLAEPERAILMKLAIFSAGFSREAAQTVAGASLLSLRTLVNKSLLRPDITSGRYTIHPLLRNFAAEKLHAAGMYEQIGGLHSRYFCALLHQREADIKGLQPLSIVAQLTPDLENIRTAWLWAIQYRDFAAVDQAIEFLSIYFITRGMWVEAETLFGQARQALAPLPGEEPELAWARLLTYFYGHRSHSYTTVEQGLEIARRYGNASAVAHGEAELGWLHVSTSCYAEAIPHFRQALSFYEAQGEAHYIIPLRRALTFCHMATAEWEQALSISRDTLDLSHALGDRRRLAESLNTSGSLALFMGEYERAARDLQDAYLLQHDLNDWTDMAAGCLMLAWLHLLRGDLDGALNLAEEVVQAARGANMREARGVAQVQRGLIACLRGDQVTARRRLEESRQILLDPELRPWASAINPGILYLTAWGTAIIALDLNDLPLARQYMSRALEQRATRHSPAARAWGLPLAAVLLTLQNRPTPAIRYLARADHHPQRLTGWSEHWTLLARVRTLLAKST